MPTLTKNLELYYQHRPVADLTALAAVSTTGMVNGLIIEVAAAGVFELQKPAVATADGSDIIAATGGGVWLRQSLPFLKTIPVLIAASTGLNIASMVIGVPYTYQCTAAAIVTLSIIGGTLRNPPVLNGSSTTLGFNPGDVFTLTLQSDTTILIT